MNSCNDRVFYTYDAWGRQVSVTGSNVTLGNLNPIRYKSYFYDYDTGFYYLETRFYDTTVGRFISPDDPAYLGASGSVLGWNLYSYCENEPVGKVDPDGHEAICISATAVCCVCIAALATLLTSKAFVSAFSQMCTQIAKDISKGLSVVWNGLSSMATFISGKVKALNKTISLSFAKAKTKAGRTANVRAVLGTLKSIISFLNDLAPY